MVLCIVIKLPKQFEASMVSGMVGCTGFVTMCQLCLYGKQGFNYNIFDLVFKVFDIVSLLGKILLKTVNEIIPTSYSSVSDFLYWSSESGVNFSEVLLIA